MLKKKSKAPQPLAFTAPQQAAPAVPTASTIRPAPGPSNDAVIERLDDILAVLQRFQRRDRLRMIGNGLRSFLWIAIVVGSSWYFYKYGPELMAQIAEQTAQAASRAAQQSSQTMVENLPSDLRELFQPAQ